MTAHWLYLLLNIGVISIPLLLSFDRKVHFIQYRRGFIPGILAIAAFFLVWDVAFTHLGYWGFNPRYILDVHILGLPPSEWLFFLTVPYACLFIYKSLEAYFGEWIDRGAWYYLLWVLLLGAIALLFAVGFKPYTAAAGLLAIGICATVLTVRPKYTNRLCFAFLVSLIPFFIVNGVLTGTGIEEEVVWYSERAFSGIRLGTIPLEDVFYSFDLIALNIIAMEYLCHRSPVRKRPL